MQKKTIPAQLVFIFFLLSCFLCCTPSSKEIQLKKDLTQRYNAQQTYFALISDLDAKEQAIVSYVENLSLEEKLSQLFLVNLEGNAKFNPVEYNKLGEPLIPGGYLFFSYNVADTPEKVRNFTDSIGKFCIEHSKIPPLLCVDQEGGVVNRLKFITTMLPSCELVSSRMDVKAAENLYYAQALQMAALGFHMNLAPVAEAAVDTNREFLGTRSFGDKEAVKKYATAAVKGFETGGILSVLKHFPGNTNDDPHTGLPEITLSAEELEVQYLEPFMHLLKSNPSAVLMSHARTTAFDAKNPACLSPYWVTEILRNRYGYPGIVISDDIFMAALEKNGFPAETATIMAIEAGIDIIMLSEKKFGSALQVLLKKAREESDFEKRITQSVLRIVKAKIKTGILSLVKNKSAYTVSVTEVDCQDWKSNFDFAKEKGQNIYNEYFGGMK